MFCRPVKKTSKLGEFYQLFFSHRRPRTTVQVFRVLEGRHHKRAAAIDSGGIMANVHSIEVHHSVTPGHCLRWLISGIRSLKRLIH